MLNSRQQAGQLASSCTEQRRHVSEQTGRVVDRLPRELAAVYRESILQLKKLSGLSSPIQGEYQAYREWNGDFVVRLFYVRETEERKEGQEDRIGMVVPGVPVFAPK